MTWLVAAGSWSDAGTWDDAALWLDAPGLVAEDIVTGAPTLGSPVLGINHVLSAQDIETGAPVLGEPRLRPFVPWAFRPMPDSSETLSWDTDVMRSDESEMRVSLRPARQTLTYNYNLRDPRNARAEGLVRAFPLSEWLVPVWHEGTSLGAVSAIATTLAVDTNADYRVGASVMIWGGCDDYVIRQIASVGSGTITLSAAVGQAFTSARIMPAIFAWMTDAGWRSDRIQERGISSASVSFLSREVAPDGVSPFAQYFGLDLVGKCGAVEPLQASFIPSVAFIDSRLGPVEIEPQRTPIDARYTMAWRMRGLEKLWARRLWLHLLRGRDRAFWLADWSKDFTLQAAVGAADTSILVAPILPNLEGYVGRHILIDDGTETPRQITAAVQDGLNHRLSISAIGRTVPPSARVGFLRKVRLDSDTIEFAHRHDFYTAARLPLIEVPE